jgi:hypothetical protein
MRTLLNIFAPVLALAACVAALAQGPNYQMGRTPTAEEIRAWDIAIAPDGKELPQGSGTAAQGLSIYAAKCARCHGPNGDRTPSAGGGGTGWVRRVGPNRTPSPTVPLATTIWDQINRSMPRYDEGSLTANEVYALTALYLYWNGVIQQSDVMDAKSLPKVQMPNRNGYVPLNPNYKQYMACNPNLVKCFGAPSEK